MSLFICDDCYKVRYNCECQEDMTSRLRDTFGLSSRTRQTPLGGLISRIGGPISHREIGSRIVIPDDATPMFTDTEEHLVAKDDTDDIEVDWDNIFSVLDDPEPIWHERMKQVRDQRQEEFRRAFLMGDPTAPSDHNVRDRPRDPERLRPREHETNCIQCGFPIRYFSAPGTGVINHKCSSCGTEQQIDTESNRTMNEYGEPELTQRKEWTECARCGYNVAYVVYEHTKEVNTSCPRCERPIHIEVSPDPDTQFKLDGPRARELSRLPDNAKEILKNAEVIVKVRHTLHMQDTIDDEYIDKEMLHKVAGSLVDEIIKNNKLDINKITLDYGQSEQQEAETFVFTRKEWEQVLGAAFWAGFDYAKEQEE